jgi:hypothetical protein
VALPLLPLEFFRHYWQYVAGRFSEFRIARGPAARRATPCLSALLAVVLRNARAIRGRLIKFVHRRQAIKLSIFRTKISEIGPRAQGPACRPRDNLAPLELPPMLVEMLAQPAVKRTELPLCNLARNIRMSFDGGSIELRAENVALV